MSRDAGTGVHYGALPPLPFERGGNGGTGALPYQQARSQDLVAGGAKNQKEGPKTRRGAHNFKIQFWMYAATGGQMLNGGHRFQMRGRHGRSQGGLGGQAPPNF